MTKTTEEGPYSFITEGGLRRIAGPGLSHVLTIYSRLSAVEVSRLNTAWLAGRSSVTAQVELSESQWAVLSNRMIEEHRKYGNHLREGHWAEIAARKVVSHLKDFGCIAAPSTVPLSPEMVKKIMEAIGDDVPGKAQSEALEARLLGIRCSPGG